MKRTLFYGLICSLLALPALANAGEHAPDFSRLADRLGLDAAQSEQFTAAMAAQHERNKARLEPLRAQMKQARAEISQETNATASSYLTPEQMEKFERMQERRAKRHDNRRSGGKERGRRRGGDDEQL
ncbi:MAG: hypothetical protein AB8G16_19005 [Gammaproteobacteria bacterium]